MPRRARRLHPTQLVIASYVAVILAGAALLLLPVAADGPGRSSVTTALFTSTSATAVTGLVVVDTSTHWSTFGEVVIMLLVQIGGFGVITLTTALTLLVVRRLNLRGRLLAQAERGVELGDLRRLAIAVLLVSLAVEAVTALVLTVRFAATYDYSVGEALYQGVFHAVMAYNNAGFVLFADGLGQFVGDPWICVPIALAVIAGGLGFPVWIELAREARKPGSWSLHTKLTLTVSAVLLVGGMLTILVFEWSNARTFADLDLGTKLNAAFFHSVQPRSGGFATIDYGLMRPETLLVTDMLMFVGAGSASTGGGIKVTTFAVLGLMVLAEARGDPDVHAFGRRVPARAQRQALAVAFVAINVVVIATLALMAVSGFGLQETLFESLSAFSTTGLSTGITPDLDWRGRAILIALMIVGRVGPQTLGVALVLRESETRYRYAEERPIIG